MKLQTKVLGCALTAVLTASLAQAQSVLPISDVHLHYSHDSVERTPPERVIELMREAQLKLALVSSSDDNGTQLLSELAPDLIVPGLRPYRRRGETGTWFTDPAALAYVEDLLATNRYATIGEFHLYGDDATLEIPRRIVELADEYNLILHAHSDADAVRELLSQSDTVKIIWAHAGFEDPASIAQVLGQSDRLYADLAFRSDVGSGGLSDDWLELFTQFPDRIMLGTDSYTPERIYFIPEHAATSRIWLDTMPAELAEAVAWKNAYDLIMPVWEANRETTGELGNAMTTDADSLSMLTCQQSTTNTVIAGDGMDISLSPVSDINVSEPFSVDVTLCAENIEDTSIVLDATMPAHGHGMNYTPEVTRLHENDSAVHFRVDGMVLHMPGEWQWSVDVNSGDGKQTLTDEFMVK